MFREHEFLRCIKISCCIIKKEGSILRTLNLHGMHFKQERPWLSGERNRFRTAIKLTAGPLTGPGFIRLMGVMDMTDTKLQEIIDTIKKHGVESGEETSRQLIEEANQKAGEILAKAQADAEAIVAKANDEAERGLRQLHSSLEIAASQLLTDLKRAIEENLITLPMKKKISGGLEDVNFLKELMTTCIREYMRQREHTDLSVLVSGEMQEKLEGFAMELIRSLPGKCEGDRLALEIKSDGVAFGFIIGTNDGVVRLDFTDEAFLELFLRYLSPRFHGLFKTVDIKELGKR